MLSQGENKPEKNKRTTFKKIKILFVDDHPLIRSGLITELKKNKDFKIVADAAAGSEAIELASKHLPDIILLDISLPDMSGLEVTSILKKSTPKIKIIALTMHKNINYVKEMRERGANGYILKDSSSVFLTNAIYAVYRQDKFYFPYGSISSEEISTDNLTGREKEVLRLIATGLTNQKIADKLFLSKRTIEAHRDRLKRKLHLTTTADLTRYVVSMDLA